MRTVDPWAMCNNAKIEVAMAVRAIGITPLPLFSCEQEVASSKLQLILEDYDQLELDVRAVYSHRQYLTAKVRTFVDFLVEIFD